MNISITIMAHPKRRAQANALLAKLSSYPFKQCYITWDEKNDEWHTGERALSAGAAAGADWHIILQDDALIPDNFFTHIQDAINNVPDRTLISMYTGTVRPYPEATTAAVKKATEQGATWIKHYMLLWGVGIILPTVHILPLIEFVDGMTEKYDIRIGIFYQRNMLPVYYTNPSLVDHNDSLDSLIGNDYEPQPRVAHKFIDGNVNWNSDFVDLLGSM